MNLFLRPKILPVRQQFQTFEMDVTRFSIVDLETMEFGCKACGKQETILAGLPDRLKVTIPLSYDDLAVCTEKLFYIGIDFDYTCVNGVSHIANGLGPKKGACISSHKDVNMSPIVEKGMGFEQTLAVFLPRFANYLRETQRFLPEQLGQQIEG